MLHPTLDPSHRNHRRSLTQEAVFIIEEAVGGAGSPGEIWQQVDRVREAIRSTYGSSPVVVDTSVAELARSTACT
ncbi:MAG: hypothetical protein RDU83_12370 [bacterium]|nr:hypothetical protein [bacterium]